MKRNARAHLLAFASSSIVLAAVSCLPSNESPTRPISGAGGGAGRAGASAASGATPGGVAGAGAGAGAGASGSAAGSSGARGGSGGAIAGAGGAGTGGAPSGGAGASGASGRGTGGGGGAAGAATGGAGGAAGSGGRTYATDRATFFGASRCAAAGVLLCDDFESGTIDTATWSNYYAAPKIDAVRAARGTKALHMMVSATGGSGLKTTKIFPRADGLYYGRMFIWFTALPTSPNYAHWTVVGSNAASSSTDKSEVRVGGQLENPINKFGVGTDHGPTGDWTNLDKDNAPGTTMVREVPKGEWVCLEWMVDTAKELTKFWWDGVEHPSLATTRDVSHNSNGMKYDLPDISSVWVGFENYNQGMTMQPSSYDVWIDEVALDAQRIGCSL